MHPRYVPHQDVWLMLNTELISESTKRWMHRYMMADPYATLQLGMGQMLRDDPITMRVMAGYNIEIMQPFDTRRDMNLIPRCSFFPRWQLYHQRLLLEKHTLLEEWADCAKPPRVHAVEPLPYDDYQASDAIERYEQWFRGQLQRPPTPPPRHERPQQPTPALFPAVDVTDGVSACAFSRMWEANPAGGFRLLDPARSNGQFKDHGQFKTTPIPWP